MPMAKGLVLYFELTYVGRILPGGAFRQLFFLLKYGIVFSNFWLDSLEQQIHSRPGIVRLMISTCDQCNSLLNVKSKS